MKIVFILANSADPLMKCGTIISPGSSLFEEVQLSEFPIQAPRYEYVTEIDFCYFSIKTYVVGTQKNRLNETVF